MIRAPAYPVLIGGLSVLLALFFFLSLLIGPNFAGTWNLITAFRTGDNDVAWMIMNQVRFPRAILGLTIGLTLGVAGATLQGYLRNPLADPGVLGISSAAGLGAVLTFYTGLSSVFPLALPLASIAGALLCVLFLQALAGRGSVLTLILAGVAISSFAQALTSLALNLSPNPYAAQEILFWILGSVTDRSLNHVILAVPFMMAGWALLGWCAPSLNALSLGEEAASSLGVNLARTRVMIVTGTAISVGAATAVSGVIGFIGLIIPHVMRPLVGHSPAKLLLASGLAGGVLLMAADIAVRVITPGTELRLGVVTSLIGAPFFLYLVLRARAEMEP